MNIAFVSNVVYPFVKGGAEKRIYEIGSRLAADGHEVTVYGRKYWSGSKRITHDQMELYGVAPEADLYAGDKRSITEAIDFSIRLLPSLRSQISAHDHDLIVASVFPYFPIMSSKIATLGTGIPLVTTWHEVWGTYWEEYLGSLSPFGKGVERATAWTPQYPIAVSNVTASRLTSIRPTDRTIEVVPNGIDVSQVQSAPYPDNDSYDIIFAGRLIEHKNVDRLLDAFDAVSEERDITLGIIGDGPEYDRLQRYAEGLESADRITFLGFLDEYENVLGHMRAADVFASPSTREGFGITFIEAMAADCTVVATAHPHSAAEEVVGDAGFLADPTVESTTEALERAISGEQPTTSPQERATQYDWSNVTEQAETVYERAVTGAW